MSACDATIFHQKVQQNCKKRCQILHLLVQDFAPFFFENSGFLRFFGFSLLDLSKGSVFAETIGIEAMPD